MRFFKYGLVFSLLCTLNMPAFAIEISELAGYSQMTVSEDFKNFLSENRDIRRALEADEALSRLVLTRPVLQKQLMAKETSIAHLRTTYFPHRDEKKADSKNTEAAAIINNAIEATKSTPAQQRSRAQVAMLGKVNTPQIQARAQAMTAAEVAAATDSNTPPQEFTVVAAASTATADNRDYQAIYKAFRDFVRKSGVIMMQARPTGDPKRDSYIPGINMMSSAEDLKRVQWPTFFTIMDNLMGYKPARIEAKQLLALLKAAQHTPEDLAALLENPAIQARLQELKIDTATLFPEVPISAQTGRVTHDYDKSETDTRGFPEILKVRQECPVPKGNVHIPRNPASRSAIFSAHRTVPEEGMTRAIHLDNANGYGMQQMSVTFPLFNNGLVHEITYAYCPGDFDGITPTDMPTIKPACLTLPSKLNSQYKVPQTEQHCLVPHYPYSSSTSMRFMNLRAKNVTLPPYVGPCLDTGPYPANYSDHTCGLTQTATDNQCLTTKETYHCHDSKNELPPQTFARTCSNGKWTWSQGYMTPASSRFRCEAIYTKADGNEISYAAPHFDSTAIDLKALAENLGDMVCAAHREGQIRENFCGHNLNETNNLIPENISFRRKQRCIFNTESGSYAWETISETGNRGPDIPVCHSRIISE